MDMLASTQGDTGAMVHAISDSEFILFRDLIYGLAGIHMPDTKKGLVSGRLGKRLRQLSLKSFRDYFARVREDAAERQVMVDLLTTNETYFFREPKHFDFLRGELLPRVGQRELRVWSAACSSGEEPYSLAMSLADTRGFGGWRILGTDISGRVLAAARRGVYPMEDAESIPKKYLGRFCLRGVRSQQGKFCIDERLRQRIEFRQLNLNGNWGAMERFHLVFLRNVMIYFNATTKAQLVERIAGQLEPGGHLVIGHSETLNGLTSRFAVVRPSVYRLK
jgi:chemotaxis protein methyltransferase CheR